MKLNRQIYLDKVRGCFLGKNIGGTIGGPTEGNRDILNIQGFSTSKGEPLPNDDLDLQLVWLHAVESEGPKAIDSETLGQYWLSFVTPYWNEYGVGKRNMERSIMPSVAGDMENNVWKHSNGAWIRTEIWATLCPLSVDTAVKFAIEDAMVDHGTGEGTHAAAFVAALESAAFGISDVRSLIEIGLSKIPSDCRVYQTVQKIVLLHDEGKDWKETRNAIVAMNVDIGDGWFQAPSNIGFVVLGLLYGEGDFKRSMLTAVNCGDDTDCTAATVGSILGILGGTSGIPEDWREYVGDRIVTCSINMGVSFPFPSTVTALTARIAAQCPVVLRACKCDVELIEGESEFGEHPFESFIKPFGKDDERDDIRCLVYGSGKDTFKHNAGPLCVAVTYQNGATYSSGVTKRLGIRVINRIKAYGNQPYDVSLRLVLPEGSHCENPQQEVYVPHWTPMSKMAYSDLVCFEFVAPSLNSSKLVAYLEVEIPSRGNLFVVPVVFLNRAK